MVGGSGDSGCHKLSENIWFVSYKKSYSGEKGWCDACVRTDGVLEFWKQNLQFQVKPRVETSISLLILSVGFLVLNTDGHLNFSFQIERR